MNKDPLPSSILKATISPKKVFLFLIFMIFLSAYVINEKLPEGSESQESFFDAEDRQKVFKTISLKQTNGFKFSLSTNSKGELSLISDYDSNLLTFVSIESHNQSIVNELRKWFIVKNTPIKKGKKYLTLISNNKA